MIILLQVYLVYKLYTIDSISIDHSRVVCRSIEHREWSMLAFVCLFGCKRLSKRENLSEK